MRINFHILLVILAYSSLSFSQEIVLNGTILDSETLKPVEYVNIGILNKNQGTITNLKGEFTLNIPAQFENDSITISHINYHQVKISVKNFSNSTIILEPKTTELTEVIVSNKKLKTRKIGVKSYNRLLSMRVISENNDIVEAAQRINIPDKEVKVKAVNFALRYWSKIEDVKVRINFYENVDNAPQKKIVFKNIIAELPTQEKIGWIHIDLNKYNIYLDQDFFIGIEFIPNFETKTTVDLGAILTKGKGYSRENSLGSWSKLNGGASINVELSY